MCATFGSQEALSMHVEIAMFGRVKHTHSVLGFFLKRIHGGCINNEVVLSGIKRIINMVGE